MRPDDRPETARERLGDFLFFVLVALCAWSAYGWYCIVLYLAGLRDFNAA